jgi:hypothetical protein
MDSYRVGFSLNLIGVSQKIPVPLPRDIPIIDPVIPKGPSTVATTEIVVIDPMVYW